MSGMALEETQVSSDVTPEAYLAAESARETRHENVTGTVYAMAGAGRNHGRLTGHITRALRNQLEGRPCEVFSPAIRVVIPYPGSRIYYYPDVVVDCSGSSADIVEAPTVIVEALSRDTGRTDRGEKLTHYRAIPSLRVYVLVDQNRPALAIYRRSGSDWPTEFLSGLESRLELLEIGCGLPLRETYTRLPWVGEINSPPEAVES